VRGAASEAALEDVGHDRRGDLSALKRQVDTIAGHRIDETRRIADQEQPGASRLGRVHREWSQHEG